PPARASNWVRVEVLRLLYDTGARGIEELKVKPVVLAELVKKVEAREISSTIGKEVLGVLARENREKLSLDDAIKRVGAPVGRVTGDALDAFLCKILDENPDVVDTIKSGQDKKGAKMKFLQGLVMKEAKGQADPGEVSEALSKKLG
ncbi:MAG: Asp-tRNA(Asn)/Glu-tRNA(Gln) amidotransferase GatCAB subunit B, partial [Synergistaceae bacterium]|nr:Asp-tRNA(Asn)/Glu-tRNA(Gln) amidotransferase GatCAB subunit B [Synergistaceae bacterium]